MAHRTILTKRQEREILGLPIDVDTLRKYYTLGEDDLELILLKRRAHNKLGFALQLCALRYPGRLLESGEIISIEVLKYISQQIGLRSFKLEGYAIREETHRDHIIEIRAVYGFCMFSGTAKSAIQKWLLDLAPKVAASELLLRAFIEKCRSCGIISPRFSTVSRLCGCDGCGGTGH